MSISIEDVDQARELVTRILSGELTYESEPDLFDEDVVLIHVRAVEAYDPRWLLDQLADERYPVSGRREVLYYMRDLRDEGIAALEAAPRSGRE